MSDELQSEVQANDLHLDDVTVKSPVLYRRELPTPPDRIRKLPLQRGYPVPWFVAWIDGVADFRITDGRKLVLAIKEHRCWMCGERLGAHGAFVVGPMCVVNRTSGEPPSHLTCALYAAQACPFMTRPHAKRREGDKPAEATFHEAGLKRNPGVAVVYVSRGYETFNDGSGGILIRMGEPSSVMCYTEGRESTLEEIAESVRTGLPTLEAMAIAEGADAVRQLAKMTATAARLLKLPPDWRSPDRPPEPPAEQATLL
jgi:hypothetical protein